MARALEKKREAAEEEAKMLLEDIERADREAAGGVADADDGDGEWGAGAVAFDGDGGDAAAAAADTAGAGASASGRRSFGGKKVAAVVKLSRKRSRNSDDDDEDDEDGNSGGGGDDEDEDDNGDVVASVDAAKKGHGQNSSRNDGVKRARGANRAAARAGSALGAHAGDVGGASVVGGGSSIDGGGATTASVPRELPRNASAAKARAAARSRGAAGAVVLDPASAATANHPPVNNDGGVDMRLDHGDNEDGDSGDAFDQRQLLSRAFAGDDVTAAFDAAKSIEVNLKQCHLHSKS